MWGVIWMRLLLAVSFLALGTGCASPPFGRRAGGLPLPPPGKDNSIQALVGRLREAVRRRDGAALAAEMTSDFGYRWDSAPQGEDFSGYWDRHQLWGELARLLGERLVAKDAYREAPPEIVTEPGYSGRRIGFRVEEGRWKFAYFVGGDGAF